MVQVTVDIDDRQVRSILEDVVEEILDDGEWIKSLIGRKLRINEKNNVVQEIVDKIMDEEQDLLEDMFTKLIEDYVADIGPVEVSTTEEYDDIMEIVASYLKSNFSEPTDE